MTSIVGALALIVGLGTAQAGVTVGDSLPDAELRTALGTSTTLSEVIKGKPSVVIVYRGGWCPYCNTHLAAFGAVQETLKELGYQTVAISPDRPEELRKTLAKTETDYIYLSDSKMNAAKAFDLAFTVDVKTRAKYKTYKIDLEAASGESHFMLPKPAAYVVDAKGKVVFSYVNADYTVRADVGDVVAAAAEATRGLLRHVVLLKLKPDVDAGTVARIKADTLKLGTDIAEVVDIEWGEDVSGGVRTQGFSHAITVRFVTEADLKTYLEHAVHQDFLKAHMPSIADLLVLDYFPRR